MDTSGQLENWTAGALDMHNINVHVPLPRDKSCVNVSTTAIQLLWHTTVMAMGLAISWEKNITYGLSVTFFACWGLSCFLDRFLLFS